MRLFNIRESIFQGLDITWFEFVDELKTIFRDQGAMLIMFIAVFTYPVVYSIAYKNNVLRDIPVTVVDLDIPLRAGK